MYIKIQDKIINFNHIIIVKKIDNGLKTRDINFEVGIVCQSENEHNDSFHFRFNNYNDRDIEYERIEIILLK